MKIKFHTSKQRTPTIQEGVRVNYGAGKRVAFRFRWYLILFLVMSPLLLFVWYATKDKINVEAEGVLTTEPIVIKAGEDAFVSSVNVKSGDHIDAHTLMIQLSSPVLQREVDELAQTVNKLDRETGLHYAEKAALLSKEKKTAEDNLAEKQALYQKFDHFRQDGGVVQLEQWASVSDMVVNAKLKLLETQEKITGLEQDKLTGSSQQYLDQVSLRLSLLKTELSLLSLNSQMPGEVKNVLVKPGMMVAKGDPLLMLATEAKPKVVAYMNPSDMAFAKLGQQATVTLPDGETIDAIVSEPTKIAETIPPQLADPFDDNKSVLKVVLHLSQSPAQTIEGLTVQVRFHYNKKNIWQHIKSVF